jgi:hypothetical protein
MKGWISQMSTQIDLMQNVEERLSTIQFILKELFPEAIGVNVHVNSEGITVSPEFRTNVVGYSMRNICGNWIKKV